MKSLLRICALLAITGFASSVSAAENDNLADSKFTYPSYIYRFETLDYGKAAFHYTHFVW